jgi:uncharacterized protein YcfJ
MDRKFGYIIFVGMAIGAVFGMGIGAANGNALFGLWLGAVAGGFLGWFIAAAAQEHHSNNPNDK